jgi:hypothetical protein
MKTIKVSKQVTAFIDGGEQIAITDYNQSVDFNHYITDRWNDDNLAQDLADQCTESVLGYAEPNLASHARRLLNACPSTKEGGDLARFIYKQMHIAVQMRAFPNLKGKARDEKLKRVSSSASSTISRQIKNNEDLEGMKGKGGNLDKPSTPKKPLTPTQEAKKLLASLDSRPAVRNALIKMIMQSA